MTLGKIKTVKGLVLAPVDEIAFYRQKFIESEDPSWYSFAEEWVEGGYPVFKSFLKAKMAQKLIKEWEEILAIRLQSKGYLAIAKQRESFQASKWLADRGWMDQGQKQTKAAKKAAEKVQDEIQDDMKRLGLRLVASK